MANKTTFYLLLALAIFLCGCVSMEQRVGEIKSLNPQWDRATVNSVAARQVELGMTHKMVIAALGKPDTQSFERDEEKWGYAVLVQNGFNFRKKLIYFVYFKDGKVVRTAGDRNELNYASW